MNLQKQKIQIALKKAHTSLGKVLDMTEKDGECFDVIQQNLAVIGLLKSANALMLERHIDQYISDGIQGKASSKKLRTMRQELIKIIQTAQSK